MATQFVLTKSYKSTGIAILLTLIFGPMGLFYASVIGGLTMTFFVPIALVIVNLIGASQGKNIFEVTMTLSIVIVLFYWVICIIWAANAVNEYNNRIAEDYRRQQMMYEESIRNNLQSPVYSKISAEHKNENIYKAHESTNAQSIQDWMKDNPGKSINDYYMKFGNPAI